jgi:hypothetical protein
MSSVSHHRSSAFIMDNPYSSWSISIHHGSSVAHHGSSVFIMDHQYLIIDHQHLSWIISIHQKSSVFIIDHQDLVMDHQYSSWIISISSWIISIYHKSSVFIIDHRYLLMNHFSIYYRVNGFVFKKIPAKASEQAYSSQMPVQHSSANGQLCKHTCPGKIHQPIFHKKNTY